MISIFVTPQLFSHIIASGAHRLTLVEEEVGDTEKSSLVVSVEDDRYEEETVNTHHNIITHDTACPSFHFNATDG